MADRAYQYVGERRYVEGVPFGSWMETGDCYVSEGPLWEGDIDLVARAEAAEALHAAAVIRAEQVLVEWAQIADAAEARAVAAETALAAARQVVAWHESSMPRGWPEPVTRLRAALLDVPDQPNPGETTERVHLACSFCGHWEAGARTKTQIAEWLRVHKAATLAPDRHGMDRKSTCPHPCGTPIADVPDQPNPATEVRHCWHCAGKGCVACDDPLCGWCGHPRSLHGDPDMPEVYDHCQSPTGGLMLNDDGTEKPCGCLSYHVPDQPNPTDTGQPEPTCDCGHPWADHRPNHYVGYGCMYADCWCTEPRPDARKPVTGQPEPWVYNPDKDYDVPVSGQPEPCPTCGGTRLIYLGYGEGGECPDCLGSGATDGDDPPDEPMPDPDAVAAFNRLAERDACPHTNRAFTIGGPEDSDGYVWCPDCRTNLTTEDNP